MDSTRHKHIVNFGPGPAKLPHEVLAKAQKELIHCGSTGISILELSHRSSEFTHIIESAEATLRQLLDIPDEYRVLFLQGGGVGQFAAVPMNFIARNNHRVADYVISGSWSAAAAREAEKYGTVHKIMTSSSEKYHGISDQSTWSLTDDASYMFYCDNETIDGVEFAFVPDRRDDVPVVCDMSSNFLSRPFDIRKFGAVFAGAQKNVGCAGVTVLIVRSDLLHCALPVTPLVWDFGRQSAGKSRVNTPPTFPVYVLGLMLEWIKKEGGVDEMYRRNLTKATAVYDVIDNSDGFYYCPVERSCRSCMNVAFRIGGPDGVEHLEKKFVSDAADHGMIQLSGHRSVGGLRASLYNAVTSDDVKQLVRFMLQFQLNHSN